MRIEEFQGSKVGILGAGREGRASHDWLRRQQPRLEITLLDESGVDPDFAAALHPPSRAIVAPLDARRLCSFDILIRSPGVSLYRPELQAARAAGVRITTPSNLWFAAHASAKTICITGTKGKSTTSALLAHMLQACGLKTRLAGNIGFPLLACDDEAVDWWVIEMSSYQIADLQANPDIAAFLNLSPEHLDWHGGYEAYRNDKLRLAELAQKGRRVVNHLDAGLAGYFSGSPRVVWFNHPDSVHVKNRQLMHRDLKLPAVMPPGLPGSHNLSNAAAALCIVDAAGAALDDAARSISSFEALPHRLQCLGEQNGITYINDSIASTPVATVAALEALHGKSIVLIVGGKDRGLDWSVHADAFGKWPPEALVGMPDNGPKIEVQLKVGGFKAAGGFHQVADLAAAVRKAESLAEPGGIVLLSPGAPSFPHFADFRERGYAFSRLSGF